MVVMAGRNTTIILQYIGHNHVCYLAVLIYKYVLIIIISISRGSCLVCLPKRYSFSLKKIELLMRNKQVLVQCIVSTMTLNTLQMISINPPQIMTINPQIMINSPPQIINNNLHQIMNNNLHQIMNNNLPLNACPLASFPNSHTEVMSILIGSVSLTLSNINQMKIIILIFSRTTCIPSSTIGKKQKAKTTKVSTRSPVINQSRKNL